MRPTKHPTNGDDKNVNKSLLFGVAPWIFAMTTALAAVAAWFLPADVDALKDTSWFNSLCIEFNCPHVSQLAPNARPAEARQLRVISLGTEILIAANLINLDEKEKLFPVLDVQLLSSEQKLKRRFWLPPNLYLRTGHENMASGKLYQIQVKIPGDDNETYWYKILPKDSSPAFIATRAQM